MTKSYPTGALKALLCLAVATPTAFSLSAQSPATTVPISNNGNYGNGQIVSVTSAFSGNITLNSGSQLFIASGGSFTGSINAAPNVEVYVQSNGNFAPTGNVNNFGGKLTNYGKTYINFDLTKGTNINNYADFTIGSNVNLQNSLSITNSACGSLNFHGKATFNSGGNVINNNGVITINGSFLFDQNNQLNNKGKIYATGNSSLKGKIINDGYIVLKGNCDLFADSLYNNNVIVVNGATTITKAILNTGLFWVAGATSFTNAGGFTQTGSNPFLRIDGSLFVDSRTVAGSGLAYVSAAKIIKNNGTFEIATTTVPKDTNNFVAISASPANPCLATEKPLPILLQNFTAKVKGSNAELQWSTASELNGKYMIVQHSTDGIHFTDIKQVASSTNNVAQNYSYTDYSVANGVNYYRLKLVATDANDSYSEVVLLKFNASSEQITSVYPSPFIDHFTIKFANIHTSNTIIKMYNDKGSVVLTQNISGAPLSVVTAASLSKGLYVLEINAGVEKYYHKLIKL